jgi:hypothetical protein
MVFDSKTDWWSDAVFFRGNTDHLAGAKQSFIQRISRATSFNVLPIPAQVMNQ